MGGLIAFTETTFRVVIALLVHHMMLYCMYAYTILKCV